MALTVSASSRLESHGEAPMICRHHALFHFASANSVGVLPVTCRNAWENAGTLA
jgi:hypothetical protein